MFETLGAGMRNADAQAYQSFSGQAQNNAAPLVAKSEPRLAQQVRELDDVLSDIKGCVAALHNRVVPPSPAAGSVEGGAKNSVNATYERQIELLTEAAAGILRHLCDIAEHI